MDIVILENDSVNIIINLLFPFISLSHTYVLYVYDVAKECTP